MHKQVIVLRKDLNMRKGKMVAQGAHASVLAILEYDKSNMYPRGEAKLSSHPDVHQWLNNEAFTKICVGVNSEQELLDIYSAAMDEGIPCSLITDSGKTEFGGKPTKTAVAVGPAESSRVDSITSKLELL